MKYSQAKNGRVFVVRLEDGEIIHNEIEDFAKKENIKSAFVIVLGGVDKNSKLIVGPEEGRSKPVIPMEYTLDNVNEITGTGTIFPDEEGTPILHMHIACGRNGETITGCVRSGVKVWQIMEVVIYELIDSNAVRAFDEKTGFKLLRL